MSRKDAKVVAVIPARLGSQRVPLKSMRLLGGKTLIDYCIDALKASPSFSEIYINSDSDRFESVAERAGVNFYHRAADLATSESLIDDYIYDFICAKNVEYLAVVNPTSPFASSNDYDAAWRQFVASDCDTQLCCERIQTHCFYEGEAINFSVDGLHPRSQDLKPVLALNFAITIWDARKYKEWYEQRKFGVYTGKLGFYITDGLANVDVDYEDDFMFAEFIQNFISSGKTFTPQYDDLVSDLIENKIDTRN